MSVFPIIFYSFGWPAGIGCIFYVGLRKNWLDDPKFVATFGFLYKRYEVRPKQITHDIYLQESWPDSLLTITHRTSTVGVVLVAYDGGSAQRLDYCCQSVPL